MNKIGKYNTAKVLWGVQVAPYGSDNWNFYIPNWCSPWPVSISRCGAIQLIKEYKNYFKLCKLKRYKLRVVRLKFDK